MVQRTLNPQSRVRLPVGAPKAEAPPIGEGSGPESRSARRACGFESHRFRLLGGVGKWFKPPVFQAGMRGFKSHRPYCLEASPVGKGSGLESRRHINIRCLVGSNPTASARNAPIAQQEGHPRPKRTVAGSSPAGGSGRR